MKIMMREIAKVVPGKMAEAEEVYKKELVIWNRLGLNPVVTCYYPFGREGDRMHTLVYQSEFDSLAKMEADLGKAMADPEIQAVMAKWEEILESDIVEVYLVVD